MANPTHIEPRSPKKQRISNPDPNYEAGIKNDRICPLCEETVYPDGTCDSCNAAWHGLTGE